jgi:hypothetical protein
MHYLPAFPAADRVQLCLVQLANRLAGLAARLGIMHRGLAHDLLHPSSADYAVAGAATLAQRSRRDRDAGHRPQPNPTFRDGHHNDEPTLARDLAAVRERARRANIKALANCADSFGVIDWGADQWRRVIRGGQVPARSLHASESGR